MAEPTKPRWRQQISLWIAGLRLLADPRRLDEVIAIVSALDDPDGEAEDIALARSHERGASALDDRYRLEIRLDELSAMQPGTFGRAFGDLCERNGLDPSALPTRSAATDAEYITAHLYETHDIWHVATGFETDIAGELGLQAFYLAQLGGRLPVILVTGGLLHSLLFDEDDWMERFHAVIRGWELGQKAQPLFGVRWDGLWGEPLEDVRRSLATD